MKRIYHFIFLLILVGILLTSAKCNKDKDKRPDILPPITQTGANSFGCKVDGEVWIPYTKCGFGNNPCGEFFTDIYKTDIQSSFPLSFSISAGREADGSSSRFLIETKTNQGISSIGNKIDSVVVNFRKPGIQLYYNYNFNNKLEVFEITKIDTFNKIISGVFEMTLYKSLTDSVRITEGRFDFKFSACKCSS